MTCRWKVPSRFNFQTRGYRVEYSTLDVLAAEQHSHGHTSSMHSNNIASSLESPLERPRATRHAIGLNLTNLVLPRGVPGAHAPRFLHNANTLEPFPVAA